MPSASDLRVAGASLAAAVSSLATATWEAGALGAPVEVGNVIVIVVVSLHGDFSTVESISDDLGNTYASWISEQVATDIGYSIWTAPVVVAGTPTLTMHFSESSTFKAVLAAQAYGGLASPAPQLVAYATGGADGVDAADSGTTSGTASSDGLKLGVYGDDGGGSTLSAGSFDTQYEIAVVHDGDNANVAVEDAMAVEGATARATMTNVGTANWMMTVLVFPLAVAQEGYLMREIDIAQRYPPDAE